ALPQANDAPSIAAITAELTALNASMAATPTSTPTTMASHCPASTAILPGRWISWVLTVSQPNSLPVIRATNTRARAPANTGNPLIVEPTARSGSVAGNKSLAVPPTGGVSPLRNAKYGMRALNTWLNTMATASNTHRAGRLAALASSATVTSSTSRIVASPGNIFARSHVEENIVQVAFLAAHLKNVDVGCNKGAHNGGGVMIVGLYAQHVAVDAHVGTHAAHDVFRRRDGLRTNNQLTGPAQGMHRTFRHELAVIDHHYPLAQVLDLPELVAR